MNHFDSLPTEINLEIIYKLSFSDLRNIFKIYPFDQICDWSFWRTLAKRNFNVPSDYFDLGLKRGLTGDFRYLEISSKYRPTLDSNPEIYEISTLLVKGVICNYQDLVKYGIQVLGKGKADELVRKVRNYTHHRIWYKSFYIQQEKARKKKYNDEEFTYYQGEFQHYYYPLSCIYEDQWDRIRDFFELKNEESLEHQCCVLGELIDSNKPEAKRIFRDQLNKKAIKNSADLGKFLGCALRVGDEELFDFILRFGNVLNWGPCLREAAFGTNMNIINRLTEMGAKISSEEMFGSLRGGYARGADPVKVYQLIERYQGDKFISPPPDVDIWQMILDNPKIEWNLSQIEIFELCLRELLEINEAGINAGNVNLLKFFLDRFVSIPGAKKVMNKFVILDHFPTSKKIYEEYLKIAG